MIENIEPILTAVFAAILYSLIWWAAKNIDPTKPSPSFDFYSLGATIVIGVFVGAYSSFAGSPLTQMGIETQLAANGAIIAVIEKVLKTVFRVVESRWPAVSGE